MIKHDRDSPFGSLSLHVFDFVCPPWAGLVRPRPGTVFDVADAVALLLLCIWQCLMASSAKSKPVDAATNQMLVPSYYTTHTTHPDHRQGLEQVGKLVTKCVGVAVRVVASFEWTQHLPLLPSCPSLTLSHFK